MIGVAADTVMEPEQVAASMVGVALLAFLEIAVRLSLIVPFLRVAVPIFLPSVVTEWLDPESPTAPGKRNFPLPWLCAGRTDRWVRPPAGVPDEPPPSATEVPATRQAKAPATPIVVLCRRITPSCTSLDIDRTPDRLNPPECAGPQRGRRELKANSVRM